jgi:hypothetical protein
MTAGPIAVRRAAVPTWAGGRWFEAAGAAALTTAMAVAGTKSLLRGTTLWCANAGRTMLASRCDPATVL